MINKISFISLLLFLVLVSSESDSSSRTCVVSNSPSVTSCSNNVCPNILSCIKNNVPYASGSLVEIQLTDGVHKCTQNITAYRLDYDSNIKITNKPNTKPSFICTGALSFLKLTTENALQLSISHVSIDVQNPSSKRVSVISVSSIYSSYSTNTLTLTDVTISNADTSSNYYVDPYYEAAAVSAHNVNLEIINSNIENCKSANIPSMIYADGSQLTISNSRFINAVSQYNSIYYIGSSLSITGSIFDNNTNTGSTILSTSTYSTITYSNFSSNQGSSGISLSSSYIYVDESSFTNNVGYIGAALYLSSTYSSSSQTSLTNSLFAFNNAEYGGAIYTQQPGDYQLVNSNFDSNYASNAADIYFQTYMTISLSGGRFVNSTTDYYTYTQYPSFPRDISNMITYSYDYESGSDYCAYDAQTIIKPYNDGYYCIRIAYTSTNNYSSEDFSGHKVWSIVLASFIAVAGLVILLLISLVKNTK